MSIGYLVFYAEVSGHFRALTYSIMSLTFVFSFIHMFFLSRYVMFNIILFIFVYVSASVFFAWHVSSGMLLLEELMRPRFFLETSCLGFCLRCWFLYLVL